jgi:PAS domain S-box-containing protein
MIQGSIVSVWTHNGDVSPEMTGWVMAAVLAGCVALALRRVLVLRRVAEARRRSEARALALFEHSPLSSWVFEHEHGRIIEANDAALRLFDRPRETFCDQTMLGLGLTDVHPPMAELLRLDDEAEWPLVRATLRRTDGTVMRVALHARALRLDGRPARLVSLEDVTARDAAEAALRQSEAEFRATADAAPAGMAMMTADGWWRYVNGAGLRMMGLPLDRVLGDGWLAACHPDDRERLRDEWQDVVSTHRSWTAAGRFLQPSGRVLWWRLRAAPVLSDEGPCRGFAAVIVDESEHRAAEEALRESEERFRQLAEHIPAVVYLVEPQTRSLLFISPAYERIWGRTRASLYARPMSFLDAVHPDDRRRVREAYRERETRVDLRYRIRKPEGDEVWIEDVQFPIRRADGTIYLMAGLAFDVSRRHRLEQQLIESQKMESLGRLAGGVAHDFNNLLTVILSYAALLKDAPEPDLLQTGLTEIENAGNRASSLTRQLLTFAQRQIVSPRVVDVNEVVVGLEPFVRHLVRGDGERRGDPIEVEVLPMAPTAGTRIDANQLDQVLINLVTNARDAMPSGGLLRIETHLIEGPVQGTEVPAGRWVSLSVADSGGGIPAADRPFVLDPFFTTKPKGKGTGLGLSTAYGIVTQCGGHLVLRSHVGQGTTVTCYLPLVESAQPMVSDSARTGSRLDGTETVLLVEDEPVVRDVARATLERHGYHVVTATNGVEGLQQAEALGQTLDLVVTDVVMPQMGGWEMARALREARPDLKILFTSGYNDEILGADTTEAEVDFLPKPYRPAVLTTRVRQVLDRLT